MPVFTFSDEKARLKERDNAVVIRETANHLALALTGESLAQVTERLGSTAEGWTMNNGEPEDWAVMAKGRFFMDLSLQPDGVYIILVSSAVKRTWWPKEWEGIDWCDAPTNPV